MAYKTILEQLREKSGKSSFKPNNGGLTPFETNVNYLMGGEPTDLSDYYTKEEVNNELTSLEEEMASLMDEKIAELPTDNFLKNAKYDSETHILTLTMESGVTVEVNLEDLVDEYNDEEIWEAVSTINNILDGIGERLDEFDAKFGQVEDSLEGKADKATTYTKDEVDKKFGEIEFPETDLSEYYTKDETNDILGGKVNNDRVLTDVPENAVFTDTVYDDTAVKADITKKADISYVDERFDSLPEENFLKNANYNSETAILTLTMESGNVFEVDLKDLIDVYDDAPIKADIAKKADKTYVDSQDATKQDKLIAGTNITISGTTISATDTVYDDADIKADIALKADKANTYTKDEVDGLIPDINDLATKTELDEKANKDDVYTKTDVDSLIENIDVDLTNYYDKDEVDTKLNNKVDNDRVLTDVPANAVFTDTVYDDADIKADIALKADKTYVDTKIDEAITGGEVDLSNYYDKTEVDGLIGGIEVDLSNYYDKDEVDNKFNVKFSSGITDIVFVDVLPDENDREDSVLYLVKED